MHQHPTVTRYSASELSELLGPVETQYCTECDVDVAVATSADQMVVSVNVGACADFDTVVLEFEDPEGPLQPRTYGRDQGTLRGDTWSLTLVPADIGDIGDFEYGTWIVTCRLSIGNTAGTSCSTGFEVID